jgi:hypothetical protein
VERAFVLGSGEARLQEWSYVALSRARAETRLYVTGTPREHESHFHDLDDRDPLARFARELEESAVEELAVDQHPLPSGPRHAARPEIERSDLAADERTRRRLLDQKQRALTKTLDTAERKLATAELDFTRCSRLRRRVRTELRTQIEFQRRAIVATQERLAETRLQIEDMRLRPTNSSPEHAADKWRSRTQSRERGLALER